MNNYRTMFVLGGLGEGGHPVMQSILKGLEDQAGLPNDRESVIDCIGFKPDAQGAGMVYQTFRPSMTAPYGSARILPSSWSQLSSISNSDEPIRLGSVCDLILDSVEKRDGTMSNTVIVIGGHLENGWDRFVTDEKLAVASQVKGQGIKFVFLPLKPAEPKNVEQLFLFSRAADALGGVCTALVYHTTNHLAQNNVVLTGALLTIGHIIKGVMPMPDAVNRKLKTPEWGVLYDRCLKAFMQPRRGLR